MRAEKVKSQSRGFRPARRHKNDSEITLSPARVFRSILPSLAVAAVAAAVLFLAGRYNYLLFHSLVEGFSIIVACGVFMLAWNSRRILDHDYLLLLGIAYFFVGAIDFVHTLAYRGMGVFVHTTTNLATEFWIGARYLQALTLAVAPLALKFRLRPRLTVVFYAIATTLLLAAIFEHVFPDCYIEGVGLTPFKITSEFIISALLALAAWLLYRRRDAFDRDVVWLLIASILCTIVSEMCFTLYSDPYGFANMFGHFLKLVSFYLMYKAVIATGLARPYDLLYRRLSQNEEKYRMLFEHMPVGFGYQEIITDANGEPVDFEFLEVNKAFEEQMGLAAATLKSGRASETIPWLADVKSDLIKLCGKVALQGGSDTFEFYSAPLNKHYSMVVYSPRRRHFVALVQDMTERRQTEEKLKAARAAALNVMEDEIEARRLAEETKAALAVSEARLRLAAEAARFGTFDADLLTGAHYWSPEMRVILGVSPEMPAPKPGIRPVFVHPEDIERVQQVLQQGLDPTGDGQVLDEHRIVQPDGTVRWVQVRGQTRFGEENGSKRQVRYSGMMLDITERKVAEEALRQLNETLEQRVAERTKLAEDRARQLQALAAELIEAEERERRRFAGLLHDDLQQLLAAAKMQLQAATYGKPPAPALQNVNQLLEESIQKTRRLSHELSPAVLYHFGLIDALQWLAEQMAEKFGLDVRLETNVSPQVESSPLQVFMFRAVQELLFNVVKHAGVKSACVELVDTETGYAITVSDAGLGFDADLLNCATIKSGFGLLSLRERASYFGGCLIIESWPGQGSRFTLTVPGTPAKDDAASTAAGRQAAPV